MDQLDERVRHTIVRVIGVFVFICLLIECGFFAFYMATGSMYMETRRYVSLRIIAPLVVNLIIWFVAARVNRTTGASATLKKYVCAICLCSLAGSMAIFNSYYTPLWLTPVIALMFCTLFHDRILIIVLAAYNYLLVGGALFTIIREYPDDKRYYLEHAVVVLGVCTLIIVVSLSMEDFTRLLVGQIKDSYKERDNYRKRLETDMLTSLHSRPFMQERAESALRHASFSTPVSIAIIDLDHFKRINDTFGHDNGDEVLRTLGEVLNGFAADDIVIGRYGGEEFLIIFTGTSPDDNLKTLERMRREFGARRYGFTDDVVTFSGGMASINASRSFEEVFRAADQALYKSKEGGRNRITSVSI